MKKALSSFYVLFFAALFTCLQSYAQVSRPPRPNPQPVPGDHRPVPQPLPQPQRPETSLIQESVRQYLRPLERLEVAQLLRLSRQEAKDFEVISLIITAQSSEKGKSLLQLSDRRSLLDSQKVPRHLTQIRMMIPAGTSLQELDLLASDDDIFVDSIAAEVSQRRIPDPVPREQQVQPNQLITLQISQVIRGSAMLDLDQLARQQLGLTIKGAQIQRVVVQGRPGMYGRSASVQVQLNGRPASEVKFLSNIQAQLPLPVSSLEEVRDLDLLVNGDAEIMDIRIRVGNVRPQGPVGPGLPTRINVNQEVSYRMPLELSRVIGMSAPIRALTIEARSSRFYQGELSVISNMNEVVGSVVVDSRITRATIQLRRPMMPSELRLESFDGVIVHAIEIESDFRR